MFYLGFMDIMDIMWIMLRKMGVRLAVLVFYAFRSCNKELYIFRLPSYPEVSRSVCLSHDSVMLFSSPSYYVKGTLVIVKIFDFRFLVVLHGLGSGESKKTLN